MCRLYSQGSKPGQFWCHIIAPNAICKHGRCRVCEQHDGQTAAHDLGRVHPKDERVPKCHFNGQRCVMCLTPTTSRKTPANRSNANGAGQDTNFRGKRYEKLCFLHVVQPSCVRKGQRKKLLAQSSHLIAGFCRFPSRIEEKGNQILCPQYNFFSS